MTFLLAAAGAITIDSPPGLKMAGFGARLDGAEGTHDPLKARALRLESNGKVVVWIACDLIGLATDVDAEMRERVATRSGISASDVFVSCSHTHGSVHSLTFRGPLAAPDPNWLSRLIDDVSTLSASLVGKVAPALLGIGHSDVPGLGYNRQDPHVAIDETLTVLAVEAADGSRIATILNYALHPVVLGERNMLYTADYPGVAASAVEAEAGGTALWIQGACGDVEPVNYRDLGRCTGTFEIAAGIGRTIAEAAKTALRSGRRLSDVTLATAERSVDLPMDGVPSREELTLLRSRFATARGPADQPPATDEQRWAAFELEWAEDLERAIAGGKVPRTTRLRLAAARIGDCMLLAIPAEVYATIGLELKQALAPCPTLIAGYTGGVIGYIPTARAKDQGGYGPAQAHRVFSELLTAMGYGADGLLVREGVSLARSLY